jgi:hypothetical protein
MDSMEDNASNNSSIVVCVSVAMVMFFTKPLPSNDNCIHIQTDERDL